MNQILQILFFLDELKKNRTRSRMVFVLLWLNVVATGVILGAAPSTASDYLAVDAILSRHCLDCHASQDPEHGLVLENFESLNKGGESGPSIIPGKSQESLLVQMIEGRFEKDGKSKTMPPGKRKKLTSDEIAVIKTWIDSGAKGPTTPMATKDLVVPKISPKSEPRQSVLALACSRPANIVAAAEYGQVELRDAADLHLLRTLSGSKGNVNAL